MSIDQLHTRLLSSPNARLSMCGCKGTVVTKTFRELHADILLLMSELKSSGLGDRDLVGLVGANCCEWVIADLALLGLDCISVALPVEMLKECSACEIIERYDLAALLLMKGPMPDQSLARCVAALDSRPVKLSKRQAKTPESARFRDIFSIAFSSGTSGKKKGLLLSKAGIANTIVTSGTAWRVTSQDSILIVMPFSNFQQRYLLYMAVWYGFDASVVAPEQMFRQLSRIRPTIFIGPPSFFEWLENKIKAESARRKVPILLAAFLYSLSPTSSFGMTFRRRMCNAWTKLFGSRIRIMLVGSAPSRTATLKLFHRIGLPLFEVYGSTEVGWVSFNLPEACKIGSVGRLAPGIRIDITEDHGIRVHSNNPQSRQYIFEGMEEQSAVFLQDGSISTGDLGHLDNDGFLHLTGRRTNIIITRSGVKISPEEMEAEIEDGCRVSKAVVVSADHRTTLSCVIWLKEWEADNRVEDIKSFIDSMNKRRTTPHYIGDIIFRPADELEIDQGLVTRNYKVDRAAVMKRYFSDETRRS